MSHSQLPFWDFFECNTHGEWFYSHPHPLSLLILSQFPLWDFGECNIEVIENVVFPMLALSIPFLGFL